MIFCVKDIINRWQKIRFIFFFYTYNINMKSSTNIRLFNRFSKRTKDILQLCVFHKTKVVKFRKGNAYSYKKSP